MKEPKVFASLTIVKLRGFENKDLTNTDPVGSANFFIEQAYGIQPDRDNPDPDAPGIIWTDYDDCESNDPWGFSVLIASDEADNINARAIDTGYEILSHAEVTEPERYGDGGGFVNICKHPEGWIVIS